MGESQVTASQGSNLAEDEREPFRKLKRIEIITRRRVQDLFGGQYHSAFKGRGISFAEVRPYQAGDEVRFRIGANTRGPCAVSIEKAQ